MELGFAVTKLDQARAAMTGKDYAEAASLAAESSANSALARIKSELATQREENRQLEAENERLRSNLPDNQDPTGEGA